MDRTDERRAPGVARVPVTTLVEICGNDPGVPAFEAESLDMSGRGMHCRTGYVPEPGNSLVCRFEHDGSEVVVEGEVAWRRQRDEGGEFGIRFTALDAKGVDTLRRLRDIEAEVVERPPAPESDKERERTETGTRVRLHIDGLGTPMKARVRDGSSRKIRVGSNLEFLKVGRHLEIEDLDQGVRTGASIDSVDVVVDPQTQVPQLVVALRYDGAIDVTPEPSVVSAEPPEDDASELEAGSGVEAGSTEDEDSDAESEAAVLRNRLGNVATHVGDAMKHAGDRLAGLSRHAGAGMGRLMKDAGARVVAFRRQQRERPVKRTTAPPPSGALSTNPE
ncbi:MAG TPA: PilZ domain-containing protein, partial [Polyangiaceae bacterium]